MAIPGVQFLGLVVGLPLWTLIVSVLLFRRPFAPASAT
jgi:hypothetical protein